MTVLRACLDCGRPSAWSRCVEHKSARKRVRNRNTATARAVIAAQPWCTYCGHRGSADNPLTSDHLIPIAVSTTGAGPQVTACRRCNSSRGAGRARVGREGSETTRARPSQANLASHTRPPGADP